MNLLGALGQSCLLNSPSLWYRYKDKNRRNSHLKQTEIKMKYM